MTDADAALPPIDHVLVHVRDALATDARVGELGLDVVHEGDAVVVRGTITTATRRDGVVPVAQDVLHHHGYELDVRDETGVAATGAPVDEPEQL